MNQNEFEFKIEYYKLIELKDLLLSHYTIPHDIDDYYPYYNAISLLEHLQLLEETKLFFTDFNQYKNLVFNHLITYIPFDYFSHLISQGLDPISNEKHSVSFLYTAIKEGRLDIAQYLIEHGAVIDYTNFMESAIGCAVLYQQKKILSYLLTQPIDPVFFSEHNTILFKLISDLSPHSNSMIKLLLENKCPHHYEHFEFGTPLMHAAYQKNIEAVKLLIEFGANIHYGHCDVLINAAWANDFDIVKLLIDNGIQIDNPKIFKEDNVEMNQFIKSYYLSKQLEQQLESNLHVNPHELPKKHKI